MSNPFDNILAADDLPSPPGVALRLLELYSQDDVNVSELAQVIQVDPVLSSKLIDYCNSPILARPRKTSSVDQAVVALGLRAVKMIGLSFSLIQTVPEKESEFDYDAFWNKSLATAIAARTICNHFQGDKETVFLMGLMLNIGQMAMAHVLGQEYTEMLSEARQQGVPVTALEIEKWSANHYELGGKMLESWKFPSELTSAIGNFSQADNDAEQTIKILQVAQQMADMLFNGEINIEQIDAVKIEANTKLGIALPVFDELFNESVVYWTEYARVLSFDCSNAITFEQLESKARRKITEMSMGLHVENSQIKEENAQLQTSSLVDALTGLKNRRAYDSEAQAELERCGRSGTSFVMMVLDLDHFKSVNDTYGHAAGDTILMRVSEALVDYARRYDSVYRIGGEEFVIILADCSADVAASVADRFRSAIENLVIEFEGKVIPVTVSIGVSFCDGSQSLENIFKHADKLLYQAKAQGRNRCSVSLMETERPNFLKSPQPLDVTASLNVQPKQ
jgi:diguanylate cyclase (GGDEF)-like protein